MGDDGRSGAAVLIGGIATILTRVRNAFGTCMQSRLRPLGMAAAAAASASLSWGLWCGARVVPAARCVLSRSFAAEAAAAAPKRAASKKGSSEDSRVVLFKKVLDPRKWTDPRKPADYARDQAMAKKYTSETMKLVIARRKDETAKIKLKQQALAALPEDLRAKAVLPDHSLFPRNRHVFTDTPPIPGFREFST